jgi:membrane-associated phospholipid phosphatase
MVWIHMRGFVARRLSRDEYLGLHLTVGLVLSLALLGLFILIANSFQGEERLAQFDEVIARRLSEDRQESPGLRRLFLAVTQLGSVPALAVVALAVALFLLLRRRLVLATVWLVAVVGGGLLDSGLKEFFERERPPYRDPAITSTSKSFPSGHAMGSFIGYGLLAYLLVVRLRRPWARVAVVIGLGLLVLAIGASRLYLGAHYLSDVIGGYAVGGFWLATCISALEMLRRRPKAEGSPVAVEGTG